MYLFSGMRWNDEKLCTIIGHKILFVSNDDILNTAIKVILNSEYKNILYKNVSITVYENGYIWPEDFKTRILNISHKFNSTYGIEIINTKIESKYFWLVGKRFKIKSTVVDTDLDRLNKEKNKTIELFNKIGIATENFFSGHCQIFICVE